MLNPEERAALVRKADSLRTEISDLTAERDAARAGNSASVDDVRLIEEVRALDAKREAALKERDEAVSATDAINLMKGLLGADEPAKLEEPPAPVVEPITDTKATKGGKL